MHKNKFQVRREATHRQLVEAGLHCYLENGFSATRIEDIVERAGFTRGAFYFHFKTKEDVLFEALALRTALREGWLETPRRYNSQDTSLEQILNICIFELDQRQFDDRTWFLVIIDFYLQTKHDSNNRIKLKEFYKSWITEISAFVDVLKEGGWVSRDRNSIQCAAQMWAFAEGYAAAMIMFDELDPSTLVTGFVKLLS